jgi:diguanylate cyclase (GGDEF)-like protein
VPPLSLGWLNQTHLERERVAQQIAALQRVAALLVDAETGPRGFVITGQEAYLQPYRTAVEQLPEALNTLQLRYAGESPDERQQVERILDNARHKLVELAQTVQKRRAEGFAAVEPVVAEGTGQRYMDEVRRRVQELERSETQEFAELDRDLQAKVTGAIVFSLAGTAMTLVLLAYLARLMWDAMQQREKASRQLQEAGRELQLNMQALQSRNTEVSTLGEMARLMQTEMSVAEVLEIGGLFCGRLLPGTHGSVYLFRNSADLLERASGWGLGHDEPASMPPAACWGLRRGQPHLCNGPAGLKCEHYAGQEVAGFHLCLPLSAYGEVLGQLHVWADQPMPQQRLDEISTLLQTLGEQMALALSNAKLRQVLRDQSIKDPLTSLFNRRYMEETLQREVARARRNGTPLSVIVVDLDHFKKVNDTQGHPVGDVVLQGVAQQLQRALRASDVACRFGGEEFILILPECAKPAAAAKAEELCGRVRQLSFKEGGGALRVSASFGVASFPSDASLPETLLELADAALYEAKRSGRDRVVVAGSSIEKSPAGGDLN